MSDDRVRSVPVLECGEALADARDEPAVRVDDRVADIAGAFAQLRAGELARLTSAAAQLPRGVGLSLVEGYRPLALQRRYFFSYAAALRTRHPNWDEGRIVSSASRYVSPPEVAPHTAGAAVDLTLIDADGRDLDMGTEVNATPEESGNACFTQALAISDPARRNRRLLEEVLTSAGLVNYPTEWWHWSYGDRYWALLTGATAAVYGPVDWPEA